LVFKGASVDFWELLIFLTSISEQNFKILTLNFSNFSNSSAGHIVTIRQTLVLVGKAAVAQAGNASISSILDTMLERTGLAPRKKLK